MTCTAGTVLRFASNGGVRVSGIEVAASSGTEQVCDGAAASDVGDVTVFACPLPCASHIVGQAHKTLRVQQKVFVEQLIGRVVETVNAQPHTLPRFARMRLALKMMGFCTRADKVDSRSALRRCRRMQLQLHKVRRDRGSDFGHDVMAWLNWAKSELVN